MNIKDISIKETTESDLQDVLKVERAAFQSEDEVELTNNLLRDETAQPVLSLLAWYNEIPVGHILFTRAQLGAEPEKVKSYILAPLAIVPEYQHMGIGGMLISRGHDILKEWNADIVFVLGHKKYYPRYGYIPFAERYGYPPPYPIPKEDWDAWMFLELEQPVPEELRGKVRCADALQRPEYWRE